MIINSLKKYFTKLTTQSHTRFSFKTLSLAISIIIIVPNIFIAYMSFNFSKSALEYMLERFMEQVTIGVDNSVMKLLDDYKSTANRVCNAIDIENLLYKEEPEERKIQELLLAEMNNNKFIYSIEIFNGDKHYFPEFKEDGIIKSHMKNPQDFVNSYYYEESISENGNILFKDLRDEGLILGYDDVGNAYLVDYITLLKAIPSGHNQGNAVLMINISKEVFKNISLTANNINYVNLSIIDKTGVVTFLTDLTHSVRTINITNEELNNKQSEVIKIRHDKKDFLIYTHTMQMSDWQIAYITPVGELLYTSRSVGLYITQITIICLLIVLIIAIILILSVFVGVEIERNKEIARRHKAELDALQMQIKPHFIYNYLDIVRWRVIDIEGKNGEVGKLIGSFSSFLRNSIMSTGRKVTLEDEITHVKSYIDMFVALKGNGYDVHFNIEDEALLSCKVMKLLLQPIVENSFIHAFHESRLLKKKITIDVFLKDSILHVRVTDNGCGIKEDLVKKLQSNLSEFNMDDASVGINNINCRIKLNFGSEYGLDIKSNLGKGTSITMRLPCRYEDV